jgi:hypothetical protein
MLLTRYLSQHVKEIAHDNVFVNWTHPGMVATHLGANMGELLSALKIEVRAPEANEGDKPESLRPCVTVTTPPVENSTN